MKSWRNRLRFAKCVFFTLLAGSAFFLLKSALMFQDEKASDGLNSAEQNSIFSKPIHSSVQPTGSSLYLLDRFSDDYTNQMVRSNFGACIAQPSKTFCFEPIRNKVFSRHSSSSSSNVDKHSVDADLTANTNKSHQGNRPQRLHPIHAAFVAFTQLSKALHIKPVLIEPSIVFCMLTDDSQIMLMKRRFNITSWRGGENVLTFAINESDSSKLSDPSVKKNLFLNEFKYWSIDMEESASSPGVSPARRSGLKTHHFFVRRRIVIHAVVFYQRNKYMWHGGIDTLPNEILNFTPKKNLLYSEYEAIYERFLPVEISAELLLEALYIPSEPRLFLHQMESSRLLYCNSSNAVYASKTENRDHEYISHEKFVRQTFIALEEMKTQLHPELMTFWIVGGTLLGWYRECGIIPYTTDVDFAAWAADIDDASKLAAKFMKNKRLRLIEVIGLPEEALEYKFLSDGLKVDLFFCYDDGQRYWVPGHRPSKAYYFPYYYPKFTLCSADLLGHKVQVTCETLQVILSDYGKDWDKPISNWNYEISPKNMGKKRFWYEEEKSSVYASFN